MKKILGLDLGTNSIGAAIINLPESFEDYGKEGNIEWMGSRIIPMDGFVSTKTGKPFKENPIDSFSKGVGISKAAARRMKRGSRRLKHRYKLRRTRLIKVFKILGWVDNSFPEDFKKELKNNPNFQFRISDYLPFSEESINEAKELLGVANNKGEVTLPEDWIVYYLRKKALIKKITFSELARITYMMNQRRGFKSSRKDLKDESVDEKKWVETLKIKSVEQETFEPNRNNSFKFKITPDKETIQPWFVEKKKKPDWEGKEFTFLITEKIKTKKDGTIEVTQLTPQIPQEGDWDLCVTALDNKIGNEHPGTYFFNGLVESIKNKTDFKIRQYAVYRSKYKRELEAIWKKQIELNEELRKINSDQTILRRIAEILYPTQTKLNKSKLREILSNDLLHLISEDIIYYQRDLKSQKNSRSICQYEKSEGIDKKWYGLKGAPKSSPEFQEFRIWQDIHNIKVLQRNGKEEKVLEDGTIKKFDKVDIDVSVNFINEEVKEALFNLFDTSTEISQGQIIDIINQFNPENKIDIKTHRINMFFDEERKLSGNETKEYFRKIFRKFGYEEKGEEILKNKEKFYRLWNISYSISLNDKEKSQQAIFRALTERNNRRGKPKQITFDLPEEVALAIASAPDIESTKKYASYSSKAINKLLPLMRCGKYWDESLLEVSVKEKAFRISNRLEEINHNPLRIKSVTDDEIQQQLLRSFLGRNKQNIIKGLNTYQACYLVYDRHSERQDYQKYSSITEFDVLSLIPNNSLRNPVVEQVVRETLFLVKDLWKQFGQPDEIHVELGRELKKNAKERKAATKKSTSNFQEKQRIKEVLYELMNEEFEQFQNEGDNIVIKKAKFEVKPNPESPVDINKFRLWKNMSGIDDADLDKRIKDEKIPKEQEIKKYALWLSQKCVSPYTGKIIPLSKLFDPNQYEIDHILPRGLVKNDSFNNLVIVEWGVNKAKGRELGALFIAKRNGKCMYGGNEYSLLDYDTYVAHCKATFKGQKLKNLLATEIPEDFISRQINDTRYITRKISDLLYPVAKGKKDAETDVEKGGIVFTIGAITSELKNQWGLQKEWKKLLKPRFERLERLNNEKYIYQNKKDPNDIDFNVKENETLDIKRIDHRHHALDALIIAATTNEHIRYLNSLNAADTNEEIRLLKSRLIKDKGKAREFNLPWKSFAKDAKEKLEQTIVTFKSNNKIFTKPFNQYQKWQLVNGQWEKVFVKQEANKNWLAVRKSLFKEPQGIIYIKEIETKSFRTPNDILKIVNLQMERMKAQNTPKQKTTSYIYDQDVRELIKQIIELSGGDIDRIKKYLKTFKPKNINGEPIYTVRIAVFKPYVAKRVKLDKSFDHKKIEKIPYSHNSRIPLILHEHLLSYERNKLNDPFYNWRVDTKLSKEQESLLKKALNEAFSEEGLEALDKKVGMKIRMVTIKEKIGLKKEVQNKLMEADGNSYYVFYENEITKERSGFTSLSTYDVLQKRLKNEPLIEPKENYTVHILQTNDTVYVPTKEEREKIVRGVPIIDAINFKNQKKIVERLYRVNDFSEHNIYFVPNTFSNSITDKELHNSAGFKTTRFINFRNEDEEGVMIKEVCIKMRFDNIGNIILNEDDYLYLKINEAENDESITLDDFKQTLFDENNN